MTVTSESEKPRPTAVRQLTTATLESVRDRVLWLATAIVDHANRVRPNLSGLKVGCR